MFFHMLSFKKRLFSLLIALVVCISLTIALWPYSDGTPSGLPAQADVLKWVDFNIPYTLLDQTLKIDVASHAAGEVPVNWIELLAYLAAQYGGKFESFRQKDLDYVLEEVKAGNHIADITKNPKNYAYYLTAYTAVLGGFVGEYAVQRPSADDPELLSLEKVYGLKAFSPIARGYYYQDSDDFGNGRSYGYARKHLGHDLFTSTGTPVIAIESGVVEALGWNQYGGWRIGIRSFDRKRYYYYAHLRKDHPYQTGLKEGTQVQAGDVIGYVGRTGYSAKENVNNINVSHLHVGMQLIFDESQKEAVSEIWIDMYDITRLLQKNKSAVVKDDETGEFKRKYAFYEPSPPKG